MAVAKHYKPRRTIWRDETVKKEKTRHKRWERRKINERLRIEGEEFEEQTLPPLTRWDFD